MRRLWRTVTCVGIVFALDAFSIVASAEPVADTASKWGLIDTWREDCSLPPGRGRGAVFSYEIGPNGRVFLRRNFGDVKDENEVLAAHVSQRNMLNLRTSFPVSSRRERSASS